MNTGPKLQAFSPRIKPSEAPETNGAQNADGSQVNVPGYLPGVYRQSEGEGQGQNQGDNKQLVSFLSNANTAELRTVAGKISQPLFNKDSPLAYLGPNGLAASFSRMGKNEVSRRNDWGDFRPGGSTQAKYLPSAGKAISFDPNDRGINATVPRNVLAQNTTVPEDMDRQVRAGIVDSNLNQGNPMQHRLPAYQLSGLRVKV